MRRNCFVSCRYKGQEATLNLQFLPLCAKFSHTVYLAFEVVLLHLKSPSISVYPNQRFVLYIYLKLFLKVRIYETIHTLAYLRLLLSGSLFWFCFICSIRSYIYTYFNRCFFSLHFLTVHLKSDK